MKIERHAGMHVDAKPAVAPGATWNAPGTQRSFEAALRDQRQRIASNVKASSQQSENRSAVSRAPDASERKTSARPLYDREPQADRRLSTLIRDVDDSPLSAFLDRALAARWRRAAGAAGAECIEVVHASSESQFLLSRENGVWLLTIKSKGSPESDEAIVQALRELFAKRGLGALDVIKV